MTQALTPQTNTGAVATKKELADWFYQPEQLAKIATILPNTAKDPKRQVQLLLMAMHKTPQLASCDRLSIWNCFQQANKHGLDIDGRLAHIVPFGRDCTLIIDYKGLVDLLYRTGNIKLIRPGKVCEDDEFEVSMGVITKHIEVYKGGRKNPYAYYSHVTMADGSQYFEIMSREEVEAVRDRSRSKGSDAWRFNFDEMAKKTVFRRACKWLPLTTEQREIVETDEEFIEIKSEPVREPETTADLRKSLGAPESEPTPAPAKAPRKQSPKPHVNIPTQSAPEPEPQLTEADPFAEEPAIEAQAELMPVKSAEDMEAKERIQLDELFPDGEDWDMVKAYALNQRWIETASMKLPRDKVITILQDPQRVRDWFKAAAQQQPKPAQKAQPAPVTDAPKSERQVKMGELGEFLSDLDPEKAILFATKQGMITNKDWATLSDANLNKILGAKTQFKAKVETQK